MDPIRHAEAAHKVPRVSKSRILTLRDCPTYRQRKP